MIGARALAALLLGMVPVGAYASCVQPTSTSGRQEAVNGPDGRLQATATVSGPNYGFYKWSEALEAWVLLDQGWIPEAESQTLQEGDYYFPPSVYGGGGGGGELPTQPLGGKGTGNSARADCEPEELPTVVVTGSRPNIVGVGAYVMRMYRPEAFRSGGGGIGKPSRGGERQADPNLTCSSGFAERELAALAVIPRFPYVSAGSVWLIRYAPGHSQSWTVFSPTSSDLGLKPTGSCNAK